ncbi:hypothetical protein [Bradyrhizobium sp. NP1]|uniref:hypothetical protein n=1 Tax=Bradyrhizobium sp. NP1 TaxID=3049772 RepID=UPI0025A52909|nr:hypothetical protein [Bradyrhizobium sp. NP1]WJR75071.1 hypothetical protein QOU61_19870 [Bradyrhizobium sp. NP1]
MQQAPCSVQIGEWQCIAGFLQAKSREAQLGVARAASPCPKCNTESFLLNAKQMAANPAKALRAACPCCDGSGSAAELWLSALRAAQYYNPQALDELLPKLGSIETFDEEYRPVVIRYDEGGSCTPKRNFGCDSPEM